MNVMGELGKNRPLLISVAVIIVLIIILIYLLYQVRQKQRFLKKFLDGVWNMDEEFCEESGLQSGYLAIDNDSGYLLLHIDGEEVINEPVKIRSGASFNPDLNSDNDIILNLESDNEEIKSLYPENMRCIVNLLEGVMIWKNNDETLAIFYKINSS